MPTILAEPGPGWLADRRDALLRQVDAQGWLRIRGLPLADRAAAVAAVRELVGEPVTEREGFAPRASYGAGVYSATEWPPDQPLCLHHELSYRRVVPQRLVFACVTAPPEGGATVLADARAVLRGLPPDLVARFAASGWRLVRHYRDELGTSWRAAFGTDDPAERDAYCAREDVAVTTDPDGAVATVQTRPAVVHHPRTGEACWFNQVAFLNEHTMAPEIRDYLVAQYGRAGLPFTTQAGDCTPVGPDTVAAINHVYDAHTVTEPWHPGDVLVVDNVLTAHGRTAYRGEREIVVGMGEPVEPRG